MVPVGTVVGGVSPATTKRGNHHDDHRSALRVIPPELLDLVSLPPSITVVHAYDPHDVYCGRYHPGSNPPFPQSIYANPFRIGVHGNRGDVLRKFWHYVHETPAGLLITERLPELIGKRCACWCVERDGELTALDPLRCHVQILAALAEGIPITIPHEQRQLW